MSANYKKFSECGVFNGCNRMLVKGDSRIMNPLMMGLEAKNPFKIPYNGMNVPPLVVDNTNVYNRLKSAYPQSYIN